MTIKIQREVPSVILLTIVVCLLTIYLGKKLKDFDAKDPLSKPTGTAFVALWFVDWIDTMVSQFMGKKAVNAYGPYIGSLALYLLIANLSGLFGFYVPTMNLSINLALAGVTWLLIQAASIKTNGIGGYLHSFIEPMPFFIFGNIISKFSPLISLSMRLFGNILSGSIIMSLVYTAANALTTALFGWIGLDFNIFGVLIAPVLHLYFDVWSGCIQMYIFVCLTMANVGQELGA